MTAHSARAHARLAPSAAHRWMACPGSVRATEGMVSGSTVYAAEGTAAHELAAHCLMSGADPIEFLGARIDTRPREAGASIFTDAQPDGAHIFAVDEEMVESIRLYIASVESLVPKQGEYELEVEQRLDMRHIHPDIFGTGDAVVYQAKLGWLHVVDLKYGKGVAVEPDENPQLLLYGAGAARRYHNRVLNGVTLHIVQPRAPHAVGPVRSWSTDVISLMEFEDVLCAAARRTGDADAPLVAGEHCRFCPALPSCPAARSRSLEAAMADFADGAEDPSRLSADALAGILKEADFIGTWVKAVQEYAHAEAVAGRMPPGFKLVAKRATRKWKGEPAEVEEALLLEHGLDREDVLTEPELRSPAALEKIVGKKGFAAIEKALVAKVSSGTNLVPESDPRPSVKADAASDFAD